MPGSCVTPRRQWSAPGSLQRTSHLLRVCQRAGRHAAASEPQARACTGGTRPWLSPLGGGEDCCCGGACGGGGGAVTRACGRSAEVQGGASGARAVALVACELPGGAGVLPGVAGRCMLSAGGSAGTKQGVLLARRPPHRTHLRPPWLLEPAVSWGGVQACRRRRAAGWCAAVVAAAGCWRVAQPPGAGGCWQGRRSMQLRRRMGWPWARRGPRPRSGGNRPRLARSTRRARARLLPRAARPTGTSGRRQLAWADMRHFTRARGAEGEPGHAPNRIRRWGSPRSGGRAPMLALHRPVERKALLMRCYRRCGLHRRS